MKLFVLVETIDEIVEISPDKDKILETAEITPNSSYAEVNPGQIVTSPTGIEIPYLEVLSMYMNSLQGKEVYGLLDPKGNLVNIFEEKEDLNNEIAKYLPEGSIVSMLDAPIKGSYKLVKIKTDKKDKDEIGEEILKKVRSTYSVVLDKIGAIVAVEITKQAAGNVIISMARELASYDFDLDSLPLEEQMKIVQEKINEYEMYIVGSGNDLELEDRVIPYEDIHQFFVSTYF